MRKHHILALICLPALAAACSSKNAAPVVYGSQPNWQGRVYSAPGQASRASVAHYRGPHEQYAGATPRSAVLTPVEVASLERLDRPQPAATQQRYGVNQQPYGVSAEDIYLENALAGGSSVNNATAGMVRVQRGDTVYAIARRTGTAPGAIIALNGMRAPYSLSVGQVIRVPRNDVAIAQAPIQTRAAPAPRRQAVSAPAASNAGVYVVRPGDTLYGVSRATGINVTAIANANNLRSPYQLSVGDRLVVPSRPMLASVRPAAMTTDSIAIASVMDDRKPVSNISRFQWPLKGALVRRFESGVGGPRNDGINIAAPVGTPVRAAADGEVVYRGSDLDGYGNLILIRHDGDFVTAYAHNDVMLVRKGQKVRQGQIISKVGQTGSAREPQLHFEIRQDLKAVDPLGFLQS